MGIKVAKQRLCKESMGLGDMHGFWFFLAREDGNLIIGHPLLTEKDQSDCILSV
jgi:hypothetical protein